MLKFDDESRRRYVLNTVNALCDEVNAEQDNYVAAVKEMHLNDGFGYALNVKPADDNASAAKIELFYVLHNYIQDMLNYLFNNHIDVSIFSDECALTLEFQVVSAF